MPVSATAHCAPVMPMSQSNRSAAVGVLNNSTSRPKLRRHAQHERRIRDRDALRVLLRDDALHNFRCFLFVAHDDAMPADGNQHLMKPFDGRRDRLNNQRGR